MFSITIDSEEYRVKFAHYPQDPDEPSRCGIFHTEENNSFLVILGVSDLLPNNRYSRNARRKDALANALRHTTLSKEQRTEVWQAYHDKRGRW